MLQMMMIEYNEDAKVLTKRSYTKYKRSNFAFLVNIRFWQRHRPKNF